MRGGPDRVLCHRRGAGVIYRCAHRDCLRQRPGGGDGQAGGGSFEPGSPGDVRQRSPAGRVARCAPGRDLRRRLRRRGAAGARRGSDQARIMAGRSAGRGGVGVDGFHASGRYAGHARCRLRWPRRSGASRIAGWKPARRSTRHCWTPTTCAVPMPSCCGKSTEDRLPRETHATFGCSADVLSTCAYIC